MDKNEELQKWLNDDRYVQKSQLMDFWGVKFEGVNKIFRVHQIKRIHRIFIGGKHYTFFSKLECQQARPFTFKIDQLKRINRCISNVNLISNKELAKKWNTSVIKTGVMCARAKIQIVEKFNLGDKIGIVVFYNKAECEKIIPDFQYVKDSVGLVTTRFLSNKWNMSVSSVNIFLKKNGICAKGKEKKQLGYGSGKPGYLYDLNECLLAKEKHVVPSLSEYDNNPIYVQRKELELLWRMSRGQANVFLQERGIRPLKKIATNKGFRVYYDRAECERARPFINQPEQKEVEKQMNPPEPKQQTPDVIPADTIDLFTMSELESELKNLGVELTAEVRAKINASDMPEMQHIAKMLRGNAKTITIGLSVLNEIAEQLVKSEKKVSWYEKIMTKLEPKQSPDVKTSIKETSESLEVESKSIDTVNIAALSKKQTLDFIRNRLQFKERIYLRNVTGNHDMAKEHRRFDMSGYDDSKCGDCTLHNLAILNEFADLGIYDYTDYLFLDFYKGQPTLYMRYFKDDKHLDFKLCGWTTSEIIYFIFQKTILSGKNKRRRD